jgi:hypothetical protein
MKISIPYIPRGIIFSYSCCEMSLRPLVLKVGSITLAPYDRRRMGKFWELELMGKTQILEKKRSLNGS